MKFNYSYRVVETNQGIFYEGQRVLINALHKELKCHILKITPYVYHTTFTLKPFLSDIIKLKDYKIQKMESLEDDIVLPKINFKKYMSMIGSDPNRVNVISTYIIVTTYRTIFSQWEDVHVKFANDEKIYKLKIIDIIEHRNEFSFNFVDEKGNSILGCPELKIETMEHIN